jgi:hypothetical protein
MLFPLLWRWQTLLLLPMLAMVGFVAAVQVREVDLSFVFGMPAQFSPEADTALHRWQLLLSVTTLGAATIGLFIGAAVLDVQHAAIGWTLPGVQSAFRRELLLCVVLGIPVTVALRGAGWAPSRDIALAAVIAVGWCAWIASWAQHVRARRPSWPVALLPYLALLTAVSLPNRYAAFALALHWPGAMLIATLGLVLLWHASHPTVHRALVGWAPTVSTATEQGEVARPTTAPTTVRAWLPYLSQEVASGGPFAWLRAIPGGWFQVSNAAFFSLVIHLTGTNVFLLLFGLQNSWVAGQPQLWYPISRATRARLVFTSQLVSAVITAATAAAVFTTLHWFDVPVLSFFRDDRPSTIPLMLQLATVFALAPLAQCGRTLVPFRTSPLGPFRDTAVLMGPLVIGAIACPMSALGIWRVADGSIGTCIALVSALAGLAQLANWWFVHAVFARRSLDHR